MRQLGLLLFLFRPLLEAPWKNFLDTKGTVNWDCLGISIVDYLLKT